MNKRFFRVVIFTLFAGFGFASAAHELECEKRAGIVKLDATGHPMLDPATGLPMFAVAPAAVLEVGTYPAAIGFRIGVHNLAAETSVVTAVSDPLLDALASKATFGTVIGPGLSLAVDGRAEQVVVVNVDSQQQCLDLFKGGATGVAPVCQNVVERRPRWHEPGQRRRIPRQARPVRRTGPDAVRHGAHRQRAWSLNRRCG